jgi:tRNA dimethylallyltransferase
LVVASAKGGYSEVVRRIKAMMESAQPKSALILLAGPTAVGKSELALLLAEKVGGEILSVDSMQVYRGLDIGTAKPTQDERARVPHHLIDVVDLTEPFDAANFVQLAREAVADTRARGRVPILSGGTGLYFKAFLDGLGNAPKGDATLRVELEKTPLTDLLAELAVKDPATYEKIDRQNARRVIRAIEVMRLTGKPFSQQRANWLPPRDEGGRGAMGTILFIGLTRASADLQERINMRVEKMFKEGLVTETEALLKLGLAENRTGMQALGYRQVVEHLRGARSLPEAIELVKIRTRQFAKRQMTWFKKYGPADWLNLSLHDALEVSLGDIIARLRSENSNGTNVEVRRS